MKKVLISILIVLLVVLAYFAIFNGLSFANIKILSVAEIIKANDKLTNDIEQVNSLQKKEYPTKQEDLNTAVQELTKKKEEYYTLAKVSTEGEITKANTEETYLIEYLWTRIGGHATSKGVNLKMDVSTSDAGEDNMKKLSFTVTGQYIGIIQFVSSLESDDKLNFKIENFKMVKNDTNLTATFTVNNVRIKSETVSSTTTKPDNQAEQNTQDTANAQNNTNAQADGSKMNQLTGAVDSALEPAENTQ